MATRDPTEAVIVLLQRAMETMVVRDADALHAILMSLANLGVESKVPLGMDIWLCDGVKRSIATMKLQDVYNAQVIVYMHRTRAQPRVCAYMCIREILWHCEVFVPKETSP